MKATAIAPANIAFIKYWGKKDDVLRLPLNSSISMNLSGAYTMTTVDFSRQYDDDYVYFLPLSALTFHERPLKKSQLEKWPMGEDEKKRVIAHVNRLRRFAKRNERAVIVTGNSFPASSGIASSASGFAALTLAGFAALGLKLTEKELTIIARVGSGSACRSIPDGFVQWLVGNTHDTSYAYSLYTHAHWNLRDIVVIVDTEKKKVTSTEGMEGAVTSPLFQKRLAAIPGRIARVKAALQKKDIALLGTVLEEECLDMHRVCQTQIPPLYYWNDITRDIIRAVGEWRKDGLAVYFTIDAGPNVHLICEAKDEQAVAGKLKDVVGVKSTLMNAPAHGAQITASNFF